MKYIFVLAASLACTATVALADLTPDALAADLQSQGYTNVEVKAGTTQLRVEAVKDGVKLEATYDIVSGQLVKSESHSVSAGSTSAQGDDDSSDDNGSDQSDGSDGGDHESDHSSGHDSGNGGGHDGGNDD